MKRKWWITGWSVIVGAVCCLCAGGAFAGANATETVRAEETQGYVWEKTECISIAPPFTYSIYDTVSFQVFFDKDITSANYKHLAAGAEALKTFGRNDTPNMTPAIIDSLDKSGVFDSMNDCIAFNGKKVREWQKLSPLACMIQAGELGVNNSINIDLNGGVPGSKITDLNQPFTFTFYEGLKFPSGVELKETVTWVYNPTTRSFSQVETDGDSSAAGFALYYNGQEITKENNLVTIYDKAAFSLDNLFVIPDGAYSMVEIEPQFETLTDGYNYVLVTCKAENGVDFEYVQVVFDLQQMEADEGCSSAVASVGGLALLLAAGGVCLAKRRK